METPEQFTPALSEKPATLAVPPDPPPETLSGITRLLQPLGPSGKETATSSGPSPVLRWLDLLLAGSVLVLAFFTASFIAVNSDFWLHLAKGRLIAEGRFPFASPPFLYTNGPEHWVHHAWLFDLSLYALYNLIGGAGLVVLKALLITILAALLLGMRRPDGNGWVSVLCTALAILAMSPALLLQPACLSLCLFGLTFWLLWLPRPSSGSPCWRRWACLLVLFALWVSLDGWFWLGPFLVGLFWMGERLRFSRPSDSGNGNSSVYIPTWLLPAAIAVCFLNPDHLHVWWPPTELSLFWSATALRQDPRFAGPFVSPWQGMLQSLKEIQLASWAYVVLIGLGPLSFVLNRRGLSAWRLLVWGSFSLLGALQARAVPFFAIVAAPITVLNLQDYLRRRVPAEPDGKRSAGAVLGRLGLLLGSLILAALAWPGWLQGFESDVRHVGWGVWSDPSLQKVAEMIGQWRQQGRLQESDRGFAFHPDIAHYCAWFCPDERSFFVEHPSLPPRAVQEYRELCRSINPALEPTRDGSGPSPSVPRWQKSFHDWGITYLIVEDADTFRRLLEDRRHWILLHEEGRAALFGWREEGRTYPVSAAPLDVNRLAFSSPKEEGSAPSSAPGTGPGRDPETRNLWMRFLKAPTLPTLETETAGTYLRLFRARALPDSRQRLAEARAALAAGMTGLSSAPAGAPSPALIPLLVPLYYPTQFLGDTQRDLAALPLLAIRHARLAIAAHPDDAVAHLRLGQAYLALHYHVGEGSSTRTLALLDELRKVQIATALQQARMADPQLETAHQLLANLFQERGYLDAALDHRREELRLARRHARLSKEASERDARVQNLAHQVSELEQAVQNAYKSWSLDVRTRSTPDPVADAESALRHGLARTALDEVLLPAPQELLGGRGAQLLCLLQLRLGRGEQIRSTLLAPDAAAHRQNLGYVDIAAPPLPGYAPIYHLPAYDWLLLLLAAATGDYDRAYKQLGELIELAQTQHQRRLQLVQHRLPVVLTSDWGLSASPFGPLPWAAPRIERGDAIPLLIAARFLEHEASDLNVLGALLALEQGEPRQAKDYLGRALQERPASPNAPGVFASRGFAEAYLRRLEQGDRR